MSASAAIDGGEGSASASSPHAAYLGTRHFPSLDGLRFLSIAPVLWHHATLGPMEGVLGKGAVGVDLFFAISGFLITTLLLREQKATCACPSSARP
jgi:peptidoglycan/LPS O-acetylase OafA/YrhL